MVKDDLDILIEMSRHFGADSTAVQAGGGNTSVKTADGNMYVKASGTTLRDADRSSFLLVNPYSTLDILADPALACMNREKRDSLVAEKMTAVILDDSDKRPSIETFLHSLLGKYVLHVHPVYINALTCLQGGMQRTVELFGKSMKYAWIPYATPGYQLGMEAKRTVEDFESLHGEKPNVVLMQNHGVVISADNSDEIYASYNTITGILTQYFGHVQYEKKQKSSCCFDAASIARALHEAGIPSRKVRPVVSPVLSSVAEDDRLAEKFLGAGALYPDQIVYCGEAPICLGADPNHEELAAVVNDFVTRNGYPPRVIVFKGKHAVVLGDSEREMDAVEDTFEAHLKVLQLISKKGLPTFLPPEETGYLSNWESEKYRRCQMND